MARQVLSETDRLSLEEEQLRIAVKEIPPTRNPVITEKQRLALEAKALEKAKNSLGVGDNAKQFNPGLRRFAKSQKSPQAPRRPSIPSFDQPGSSRSPSSRKPNTSAARNRVGRESLRHASIEPQRSNIFSKWFVMGGMALSLLYGFLGRRGQADAAEEAAETFSRPEESAAALMLKSEFASMRAEDKGMSSVPTTRESPENVSRAAGRANFNKIIDIIIRLEGGWSNDPHDSGGETYKGITEGTMADCRNSLDKSLQEIGSKSLSPGSDNRITDAEIREIYKKKYWDKIGVEGMPECLALVLMDASVNHGVGKAQQFFRTLMDEHGLAKTDLADISPEKDRALANALSKMRLDYYKKLWNYNYFGEGWENRMNTIKQECQAMYIERVGKQLSKEGALSL